MFRIATGTRSTAACPSPFDTTNRTTYSPSSNRAVSKPASTTPAAVGVPPAASSSQRSGRLPAPSSNRYPAKRCPPASPGRSILPDHCAGTANRAVGSGSSMLTARAACNRPAPVKRSVTISSTVLRRIIARSSGPNDGRRDNSNATTPLTCGAAIDVPLSVVHEPFRAVDWIDSPGATRSTNGPWFENPGEPSRASVAPTAMASGTAAGKKRTVLPLLPAAATNTTPEATARATISSSARDRVVKPQLAFTTRAPLATAYATASRVSSKVPPPPSSNAFKAIICTDHATPATPCSSFPTAPRIPATWVP